MDRRFSKGPRPDASTHPRVLHIMVSPRLLCLLCAWLGSATLGRAGNDEAQLHTEHNEHMIRLKAKNDAHLQRQLRAAGRPSNLPRLEVDEEGVMHVREPPPRPFFWELSKLKVVHEGTHEQQQVGSSYRVFYEYEGKRVSPWHGIPLRAAGYSDTNKLFHFICEIPKGETAKFEVHKSYTHNPVAQDHKKGKLRHYKYSASIVNYGALTQTWEDPSLVHPDTGAGGDNDPVDVLQVTVCVERLWVWVGDVGVVCDVWLRAGCWTSVCLSVCATPTETCGSRGCEGGACSTWAGSDVTVCARTACACRHRCRRCVGDQSDQRQPLPAGRGDGRARAGHARPGGRRRNGLEAHRREGAHRFIRC